MGIRSVKLASWQAYEPKLFVVIKVSDVNEAVNLAENLLITRANDLGVLELFEASLCQ